MSEHSKKFLAINLNQWLETKARCFERQHQYRDAALFWGRLLKRRTFESSLGGVDVTTLAAIHYRLGLAHRALNDDRKSLYHLKYSVRLNSSEPRYYEAFGRAFLSGGHWRVAKTQFEKAIRLDPKNVTYLRQYAWVLLMMGRKTDALIYAKKAYQLHSGKESLLSLVRVYMEMGKFVHALQLLKKARRSARISQLIEECSLKLDTTLEGAVIRCLRKGMVCNGEPFSLWDLRRAEELWTDYCLTEAGVRIRSHPNVWAASLAWLSLYFRKAGEAMVSMDEIALRFAASTLEIWPRLKELQESLILSNGQPQAA